MTTRTLARRLEQLESILAPAREPRMAEVRIISSATREGVQRFFTPWGEPEGRRRKKTTPVRAAKVAADSVDWRPAFYVSRSLLSITSPGL